MFEEQVDWARKAHRKLPAKIEFGAMMEVPALAEMLDQLLPRIDFLSIGTNDLTQFLFAADRSDPRLAQRYDWLSPAILRFLKRVLDAARAAEVPVRICGEMAGRPLEAMALIGLGAKVSRSLRPASAPSRRWSGPLKPPVSAAAWTSCSPSRPRICARLLPTGRADIRSQSARRRLTRVAQHPNKAHGEARH